MYRRNKTPKNNWLVYRRENEICLAIILCVPSTTDYQLIWIRLATNILLVCWKVAWYAMCVWVCVKVHGFHFHFIKIVMFVFVCCESFFSISIAHKLCASGIKKKLFCKSFFSFKLLILNEHLIIFVIFWCPTKINVWKQNIHCPEDTELS